MIGPSRASADPVFSIVMPAFNAAATIEASIASVRAQTDPDWELLVVDDRSSDATAAVVERIAAQDRRVWLMRLARNVGVAGARNAALDAAAGRYVAFLDADDEWYPAKLALQRRCLEAGAGVVFGSFHRVLPSGVRHLVKATAVATPGTFLHYNPIGNLTGAYDRRLGIVRQQPMRHEDYLMWYELVRRAGRAVGVQESIAAYRVSGSSLSGNKVRAAVWHWQMLRTGMKQPLPAAVVGFGSYAVRSIAMRLGELRGR